MSMIAEYLLVTFLFLCFKISQENVCEEQKIFSEFRKNKIRNVSEVDSWKPFTRRSMLASLEGCTEYHGSLIILDSTAIKSKVGENIRSQDFYGLRNIKKIVGTVHLDLRKYPEIKNLSFLSSLREVHGPHFDLVNSYVEMLGLHNVKLNVANVTIAHNEQLCYLQRFETLSSSIAFTIADNKDSKLCALEGKKCSPLCDAEKGCWGPSGRHCFRCLFKAGVECVEKCESQRGFFTLPTGPVCGRCHVDCRKQCPRACRVCREKDLMDDLWRNKPGYRNEMEMRGGLTWTPRSVLLALKNCTVYYGKLKIKDQSSTMDTGYNEYVRVQDIANLRNLREIYGNVYINLRKYPEIITTSFFSSLTKIETSERPGFTFILSQVEMIGFSNIQLNVPRIGIGHNSRLCYLDRIETFSSSSEFTMINNKDPSKCRDEGKVCSKACNPNKGCWGPRDRHCFECRHWRTGDECVDSCESRRLFKPPKGQVCVGCHKSCRHGCFGPNITQCSTSNDQCPKYKYFNASGHCDECSPECFGGNHEKRHLLIVRACTGPGNFVGSGGCTFGCPASSSLTVSSDGRLECVRLLSMILLLTTFVSLLSVILVLIVFRKRWSRSSARNLINGVLSLFCGLCGKRLMTTEQLRNTDASREIPNEMTSESLLERKEKQDL